VRLRAVLEDMPQHDEVKVSSHHRRQALDTLDRLRIRYLVHISFRSEILRNELPAVPAIVEHRLNGSSPFADKRRQISLSRCNLLGIASDAIFDASGIAEFIAVPGLEVGIASISSVKPSNPFFLSLESKKRKVHSLHSHRLQARAPVRQA
jgi:hypothetical protein